ncbi:hypothetical protein [Ancylobacter radicis]|uniref:Uncharacterized protein n=1 Tax=Ancylobacter radicis TaxID=2836179 RepID=A0ABS5R5S7_9HYPH|nr:hypothetical protein [Ancylobacter radicis]MBS9476857.1 hypothetical protein [Ancylobacter radicis]
MALSPVRATPKLSASQLADYLVAPTPVGQMGILRQAKNPGQSRPLIIQYQHARRCISACLQSPASMNRLVASAVVALEQRRDDPSSSPLVRDDAIRSIDVIQTFQRAVNSLDIGNAVYEPGPNPSNPLSISGVDVTVWPDAVAKVSARNGETRVGEVFIRCTIGAAGDGAENRRSEANGHLATIAHMHAAANLTHLGTPYSPASMVIDVSRGAVVRGPSNITRRVANIEAACAMIAAIWPTV